MINFNKLNKTLVIAEIGNNHEGNFEIAKLLIEQAAEAGADAVKFQTIIPEKLVAPSQKDKMSQLRRFQLSYEQYEELSRVAEREGVLFLSTPFDIESARFLNDLVPAFKIASGDNNFWALIDVVARTGKPILLSSGFTDLKEIKKTRDFIQKVWQECGIVQEMAVLHCVSSYPTPPQEANLLAIKQLREQLGVTIGYSDHTLGIEAAVLAVALGARIIEKHFTVDKNYSNFRDHPLSADPKELAEMVRRIEKTVELLGDGEKRLQECERENIGKMRRSIVAKHDLPKDARIGWDDITWTRPADGLPPGKEDLVLGKFLSKSVEMGELLVPEILYEKGNT